MQRIIKNINHTARGFAYVALTGAMIISANYFNHVTAQTAQPAATQSAPVAPARYVTGEVITLDTTANQLTLKTDAGESILVVLTGTTAYNRLPGGETSPAKAVPATLADVAVGDRVLVDRGRIAAGQTVAAASKVFVMSKADVAAKQARDQAEWRNGIVGVVTAVNLQGKEITVQPRGRVAAPAQPGTPPAASPVVLKIADSTLFRRYAPESVRFADARIGALGDLKVGDQLRARGERTPDSGLVPKEIVSGSFRTLAGFVSAVNPTTNEVTLTPLGGGAPVIVNVKADSTLRRVPPMMAMMMANRGAAGGGGNNPNGAPQRAGGGRPERQSGAASPAPNNVPDESNRSGARGGGNRGGMMGGGNRPGGVGFDLQEAMERLPALTIADLKAGDGIVVSSTDTGDATRATAITLIAGVEALLASPAARSPQGRGGAAGGFGGDAGGFGGFDLGIGGP